MAQMSYSAQTAVAWADLVGMAYSVYEAAPHVINPEPPTFPNNEWRVIANLVMNSRRCVQYTSDQQPPHL
jgi:hypothetical protein